MSNKLLRTSDPTVHGPHRGLGGVGSGLLPRGNSWFRGGFGKKKRGGGEEEGEEEEAGSPSCRGWGLQAEGQPGAVGEPQGESVSPEPCVPGDRAGVPPRGSGGSQRVGGVSGGELLFLP